MYRSTTDAECQNCGALLPAPDGQGTRTCTFCHASYAAPAAPASATPPQVVFTSQGASSFQPINAEAAGKAGCGVGGFMIFILIIVVASVAIPLYFAFRGTDLGKTFGDLGISLGGTSAYGNYRVDSQFLTLPAEPTGPAPFVAITTHYDQSSSKSVDQLIKVNGKDQEPAWKAPALTSSGFHPLTSDGVMVYVGDGSRVAAINLKDGTAAWEASLSDELSARETLVAPDDGCSGCFVVMGGKVVAKSKDGVLAAFDATTGAPTWSKRLQDVNAKVLRNGTSVLLIDGAAGAYTAAVIDPATGNAAATMSPVCPRPGMSASFASELNSSAKVIPSADGASVLFLYGTGDTCLQRWDAASGAMTWNVNIEGSGMSASVLDAGGMVVVSGGPEIGVVDAATGAARQLPPLADMDAQALAVSGNVIVFRAETTRGTTKHQLVGVDATDGHQMWTTNLGDAMSVDLPKESGSVSNGGGYTAHVDGASVRIVMFSKDKQLSVQSVDVNTGAATPTTKLDAKVTDLIPDFGPGLWAGSVVTVPAGDKMVTVSFTTPAPTLTFAWPG